jgi:hypothetical protein
MAAFWAVFTFGGSGPALTAHGSLDLKQEIQIQSLNTSVCEDDNHVDQFKDVDGEGINFSQQQSRNPTDFHKIE